MAITGSQPWYLPALGGVARGGASRGGGLRVYAFGLTILEPSTGVSYDLTRYIAHGSLTIAKRLNDQVDTAIFTLLPSVLEAYGALADALPRFPRMHAQVTITLAGTLVFGGELLTVQRRRVPSSEHRPWFDCTAVDYLGAFDSHLVVADYPQQSITTTIADLVARFVNRPDSPAVPGQSFSTLRVQADLPTAAGFSVVHERPSTIVRRMTVGIQGGFYVDATRTLHVFDSAGEDQNIGGTRPTVLTEGLKTLKSFAYPTDATQQRNRVWAEGKRTDAPLGLIAYDSAAVSIVSVPVRDASIFPATFVNPTMAGGMYVRIGTQICRYGQARMPATDASNNPLGTTITADVDVGQIFLYVESTVGFESYCWALVGGQYLWVSAGDATTLVIRSTTFPGITWGGVTAPITAGSTIVLVPYLTEVLAWDRGGAGQVYPPTHAPFTKVGVARPQPLDAPVVLGVWRHAVITPEGPYIDEAVPALEHLVQDGRLAYDGVVQRATTELANYQRPITSYKWDTEDLNADVGRVQTIAMGGGGAQAVNDTVLITSVTLTVPVANRPPRRAVVAERVITAGVLDSWVTGA